MIVGIIDSGVNIEHAAFAGGLKIRGGYRFIKDNDGRICQDQNIYDEIGHGTSVCWIINKYLPDAEFVIFKVFSKDVDTDEEILIHTFEYIRDHIHCGILNVSAGIQSCSNIKYFQTLCDELQQSGTIVISAFDNEGGLSYPACFDSVIGVDISASCFRPKDYFYIEDSPINIRGFGYSQKLPSLLDQYSEQKGASFAAPIISGMLAAMKAADDTADPLHFLREHAKACYSGTYESVKNDLVINEASVFPVSKETKSLIENAGMLPFRIKHIYDLKYSGNVGKRISQMVYPGCALESYLEEMVVEPIEQSKLNDVDTMIIGHVNMLQTAASNSNIKQQLIKKARAMGTQVYLFDNIGVSREEEVDTGENGIICPCVTNKNVPCERYGKLYCLSTSVLGIFGTSPKQGKFTLQLKLRKRLSEVGYKVANVGTEPTAMLFGFEETYPIGYNSTVSISGERALLYLNERMHCIEEDSPDIIIVGSQSQSVSNGVESIGYIPIKQHELILGTSPDAYILVVNTTDDMGYIQRTISFLSSITPAKVIALVASPIIYNIEGGYQTKVLRYVEKDEMAQFLQILKKECDISSYSLDDEQLVEKLQNAIEDFYS
ncbi:MAG: DUF1611 domain-containing protein [Lachnospiraceae bacterium]|nr:DUF1611 domain-containing protein [Lachnospiraceae bacterium]